MKFKKFEEVTIINTNDIWENKKGIILADVDNNEITDETEEYLVKVFFSDNKTIIQPFSKDNLKVIEKDDYLTESIKEKNMFIDTDKNHFKNDFIYPYVFISDLDDNIVHSWMFADKIATAEDVSVDCVIKAARTNHYKIYLLTAYKFKKIIIAAPKCTIDTVYDEYGNYLLGKPKIIDITNKKEK